jgi:hypothetical protein
MTYVVYTEYLSRIVNTIYFLDNLNMLILIVFLKSTYKQDLIKVYHSKISIIDDVEAGHSISCYQNL